MAVPGLKFFAESIVVPTVGLQPTMSTYGLLDLSDSPVNNELYVVCKNGTIKSVYNPASNIGWELIEEDSQWFYRVTQMNHKPQKCLVRYHSTDPDPPAGRGRIGSIVMAYHRKTDTPREAEITEHKDTDLEVISKYDPMLAKCATIVNDTDQTAAMAKFVTGQMSYAEMRRMCG